MGLIVNGTEVDKVVYNGTEVEKVVYNGTVVFEKLINEVFLDGYFVYMPVSGYAINGDVDDIQPMYLDAAGSYSVDSGISYYSIDDNANVSLVTDLVDGDSLSGLFYLNENYSGNGNALSVVKAKTDLIGNELIIPNSVRGYPVVWEQESLNSSLNSTTLNIITLTLGENLKRQRFSIASFNNSLQTINYNCINLQYVPVESDDNSPTITINVGEKVKRLASNLTDCKGNGRVHIICPPNGVLEDLGDNDIGGSTSSPNPEAYNGTLKLPVTERFINKGEPSLLQIIDMGVVTTQEGGPKWIISGRVGTNESTGRTADIPDDAIGILGELRFDQSYCVNHSDFTFPSSIKYISSYAVSFNANASRWNSITIPNSVIKIGENAFNPHTESNTTSFITTSLTIGNGIVDFPNDCFFMSSIDKLRFMHDSNQVITFASRVFGDVKTAKEIAIYTDNDYVKAYDWEGSNITPTFYSLSEWED